MGDTPETSTWNSEGGGTPQKEPRTVGVEGDPPETATWNSGVGDTPHLLLFVLPQKLPILGGEDFTNHQLRRRTGGKDKRTEQGEMLFRLLAFISTFSEAFIFYLTKNRDMYFSNHCISGVPRFLSFLILFHFKIPRTLKPQKRTLWRHFWGPFSLGASISDEQIRLAGIFQSRSLFSLRLLFHLPHGTG